jgi:peptidoglycan/LPS O-acetylase OafA/YrhL
MHLTALLLATMPMLYCIVFQPGLAHSELGDIPSWRSVGLSWIANLILAQTWLRFWRLANLWNPPAWSLGCEFFFYALLPFFVALVLRRIRSARAILLLVFGLYGVEITMLAALALVIPHLPATPFRFLPGINSQSMLWFLGVFSPVFRVWEFFIGCALGALYLRLQNPGESHALRWFLGNERARNILVGGSCVAALAVVAIPDGTGSWQGQAWTLMRYHPAFTPFFGILILTLASGRNFLSDLLEHPRILMLGEASYSLYITHHILFQVLAQVHATGRPIPVALPLLLIPGSVALSLCFWKWVETPLRKLINPRKGPTGTPQPTSAPK